MMSARLSVALLVESHPTGWERWNSSRILDATASFSDGKPWNSEAGRVRLRSSARSPSRPHLSGPDFALSFMFQRMS